MQQTIQKATSPTAVDAITGISAGVGGATGVAYQMFQEVISVATMGLNLVIAVAGLYLIILRIRRIKNK